MIGAVSLKIVELERNQSEQQSQLDELELKVEKNVLTKDDFNSEGQTLKTMLLQFQAGIKEQNFRHNDIKSKFSLLSAGLDKLKHEVRQNSEKTQEGEWRCDTDAPEFTPRNGKASSKQDTSQKTHHLLQFDEDEINSCQLGRQRTTANQTGQDPVTAYNKNYQLDALSKEELFKELIKRYEDQIERERAWLNKEKWYSHKLRLLRQDKRRRGDTIGKLLRSIDEMRDWWRVQNSLLANNNHNHSFPQIPFQPSLEILSKVHDTRTLSGEKRIEAVIEIAETEKNCASRSGSGCWGGCNPCPTAQGIRDAGALSGSSTSASSDLSASGGETRNDNNNCHWAELAYDIDTDNEQYYSDDSEIELIPYSIRAVHLISPNTLFG